MEEQPPWLEDWEQPPWLEDWVVLALVEEQPPWLEDCVGESLVAT